MTYWVVSTIEIIIQQCSTVSFLDLQTVLNALVNYSIANIKLEKRTARLSIPTTCKPLITNGTVQNFPCQWYESSRYNKHRSVKEKTCKHSQFMNRRTAILIYPMRFKSFCFTTLAKKTTSVFLSLVIRIGHQFWKVWSSYLRMEPLNYRW